MQNSLQVTARRHKILIVEDDRSTGRILAEMIRSIGCIPVTATTGEEAKLHFKSNYFVLCLLDLILPDTTGQRLCQYIRTFSAIPIVVLSTREDNETIVELFQLGADEYIVKPAALSVIKSIVFAQLRRLAWIEAAPQKPQHGTLPAGTEQTMVPTHGRLLLN